MTAPARELQGLTILVVEDNFLVAEVIRELIEERGATIVGPVPRVAEALHQAETARLDGALLDINLAGEFCFPVAGALRARAVPFLFLTGYDEGSLIPPEFRDVTHLSKPFDAQEVVAAAARLFRPGGDQAEPRSSNGAGAPSKSS